MPFQIRTRADDGDKHIYDVNCMIYHKGKLYSGADDGKIKVWEEDLKLISEIQAHESSVYSITAANDTIYSCSNDGSVKSFTLDLKEKLVLYKGDSEIWKLVYNNNLLYAGDNYGVVYIFANDQPKGIVNTTEPIKGMIVDQNILYTVRDLDVVIVEMQGSNGNTVGRRTLMGREPICVAGNKLCFSSRSGKEIMVHENNFDLEYKAVQEISDAHEMIINALCGCETSDGTLLFSGGWDKIVKQWKISNGNVTLVNQCNVDMCINALAVGEKGEIYAGGNDGHIVRIDL